MKKGEGRKTCNKSTKTCAGLSCRKYKMMLRESAEGTAKLLSRFSRARLCGPARLPRPWDSPGRNTGVGCHFLLQSMKEKGESLSRVRLFKAPWTAAHQTLPSMGFSRQECWSGRRRLPQRKVLILSKLTCRLKTTHQHSKIMLVLYT